MARPIRTLLFSTLYPSSARPVHGIFVETRLRELLRSGEIETKVIAPVPWFPSSSSRWGKYANMAATAPRETRNGIDVLHPRYLTIPKVGMSAAPLLLAAGALGSMKKLIEEGFDFDVIDAHYYYPDGVAAVLLARHLGKPVCITARGTDLNLIPQYALPRKMIQWSARHANASIGVCSALVNVLRNWNIDESRLHVMRNGVDLTRFRPLPQMQTRRDLRIEGSPVLLSVGNLLATKGHHIVIEALERLLQDYPAARLFIIGAGPEHARLQQQTERVGLSKNVTLVGAVPNDQLARWYSAADVLVLASAREGWANVLLESMACGTPVIATAVGGSPEVVAHPNAGRLVPSPDAPAIAQAVKHLLANPLDRGRVRTYAEGFGWELTSRSQIELFERLATMARPPSHA